MVEILASAMCFQMGLNMVIVSVTNVHLHILYFKTPKALWVMFIMSVPKSSIYNELCFIYGQRWR